MVKYEKKNTVTKAEDQGISEKARELAKIKAETHYGGFRGRTCLIALLIVLIYFKTCHA